MMTVYTALHTRTCRLCRRTCHHTQDAASRAGADLETAVMNGVGPPQQAAAQGNLEVMSVLMKAGGNLNTRSLDGATPLFMAAQKGYEI